MSRMMPRALHAALAALALGLLGSLPASAFQGQVIDGATQKPVAGATVTLGGASTQSDDSGNFALQSDGASVMVRAPGYLARTVAVAPPGTDTAPDPIALTPFTPKALYLSYYGVAYKPIRDAALDIIHKGEANAVVVDIKGDRGLVAFPTQIPLVAQIGANKPITIHDLPKLVADFHAEHVYVIARIVTFKDNPLATAKPDLAVHQQNGQLFRDHEGLAWVDPFQHQAWDYNAALGVEAAKAGFDEVQYDYVRFPDSKGVKFSQESTEASRTGAIDGFLSEVRSQLAPYNVYLSADVFGYTTWNTDDTDIGQEMNKLLPIVDYLSPMLYPSGFQFGIPGYRDPVEHPYEIVKDSLDRAELRTKVSSRRFRPWLQAFRDYAFDHRDFDADGVKAQTKAASDFGSDGWMLWNPRNSYGDVQF